MKLTYLQYLVYIKFACDEELERLEEFLYSVNNNYDCSEDKYYVACPTSNCPPDKDDVELALKDRDMAADFLIIHGDNESDKEDLYETLRMLVLYS